MLWGVVLSVVLIWLVIFYLTTGLKKGTTQAWGDVVRSLANIFSIQFVLIRYLLIGLQPTLENSPYVVTGLVTSAISYNVLDTCLMFKTNYKYMEIFTFHHMMVILGALLPVVSGSYYELYLNGAIVEWSSGLYNVQALYQAKWIGKNWSETQQKIWNNTYRILFNLIRIIGIGGMVENYYADSAKTAPIYNFIYLLVVLGIGIFSVYAALDMFNCHKIIGQGSPFENMDDLQQPCSYCKKDAIQIMHDQRGCKPVCQHHFNWRSLQSSMIRGHSKDCHQQ